MSKKREKIDVRIDFIGSPYKTAENETMDDWYSRYKADPAASIEMNGKTYYRIISMFLFTKGEAQTALCNVDRMLFTSRSKNYIDENGNIFEGLNRVHMKFNGLPPDWYFEAPQVEFSGNVAVMGEYLAPSD